MKQMDLFDMPAAKGLVGGRQSDLEELIAWEDSLAAAVFAKDDKKRRPMPGWRKPRPAS